VIKPASCAGFFVDAGFVLSLKLLVAAADICIVQKSTLIAGLSLALGGATLVGVGEWAAGRLANAGPDGRSAAPLAAASYSPARVAPMSPALPVLPETSDHLPANTPEYSFRRDIPEVRLQFTVADQQGRAVKDVSPSDVQVFDNQTPVAGFNEFERDDNLPLQIGLLIDASDSVKRVLPDEKAAAARFLDRILRPQTDSAFVIGFGGEFKVWQEATEDRQALFDAITRLQEPGWGTRFYDALYLACDGEVVQRPDGRLMHRAVVVLSDGDDNQSMRELRDVVAMAVRGEVQVYALTIRPRKAFNRGDAVLQQLADATGGRVYVVASSKALDVAFAQIEQDLRTQYYVSFSPQQATPGFHALRVEVKAQQPLQVHAREGYYAFAQ
jgi:Ca-activated chloride channel homolog